MDESTDYLPEPSPLFPNLNPPDQRSIQNWIGLLTNLHDIFPDSNFDPVSVSETLLNQEFIIDPHSQKIIMQIHQQASERFGHNNFSLLILGNRLRGGSLLKFTLHGPEIKEDVDWGVVSSSLSSQEVDALTHIGTSVLQSYSLSSCPIINPTHVHLPLLKSPEDALTVLDHWPSNPEAWNDQQNHSISHLDPAFPASPNRQHLLDALSSLSLTDFARWSQLAKSIFVARLSLHRIKFRHLNPQNQPLNYEQELIMRKITKASAQMMSGPFRATLNSTNLNPHHPDHPWWL